jgi:anaerobic ribonucleoside-triphosphate reductase activating protein
MKDLLQSNNKNIQSILNDIDILIDGPFIEELKDLSLKLRGSSNQIIWQKKNGIWMEG